MLEIHERATNGKVSVTLTLPVADRQRSRLRVRLSNGEDAALMLPRGGILRDGDLLRLSDGRVARVVAAPELVSTVRTDHAHALARVAYHLGNRHVALQVGDGFVRYLHDHVLDEMVRELGLKVQVENSPFEPEAGAYGQRGSHAHSHDHSHLGGTQHGHSHQMSAHHHHSHDDDRA